jgi:hypothetical protein
MYAYENVYWTTEYSKCIIRTVVPPSWSESESAESEVPTFPDIPAIPNRVES